MKLVELFEGVDQAAQEIDSLWNHFSEDYPFFYFARPEVSADFMSMYAVEIDDVPREDPMLQMIDPDDTSEKANAIRARLEKKKPTWQSTLVRAAKVAKELKHSKFLGILPDPPTKLEDMKLSDFGSKIMPAENIKKSSVVSSGDYNSFAFIFTAL